MDSFSGCVALYLPVEQFAPYFDYVFGYLSDSLLKVEVVQVSLVVGEHATVVLVKDKVALDFAGLHLLDFELLYEALKVLELDLVPSALSLQSLEVLDLAPYLPVVLLDVLYLLALVIVDLGPVLKHEQINQPLLRPEASGLSVYVLVRENWLCLLFLQLHLVVACNPQEHLQQLSIVIQVVEILVDVFRH